MRKSRAKCSEIPRKPFLIRIMVVLHEMLRYECNQWYFNSVKFDNHIHSWPIEPWRIMIKMCVLPLRKTRIYKSKFNGYYADATVKLKM